jgi:hypothetical protein
MSGFADHTLEEWTSKKPSKQQELVSSCRAWLHSLFESDSPYMKSIHSHLHDSFLHLREVVPDSVLSQAFNLSAYEYAKKRPLSIGQSIPQPFSEEDFLSFTQHLASSRSPEISLRFFSVFSDVIDWKKPSPHFFFLPKRTTSKFDVLSHVHSGNWLTEALWANWPTSHLTQLVGIAQRHSWQWTDLDHLHSSAWPWLFFLNAVNDCQDVALPPQTSRLHEPTFVLEEIERHLPSRLQMRWTADESDKRTSSRPPDFVLPFNRFSIITETLEYVSKSEPPSSSQVLEFEFLMSRWAHLTTPDENTALLHTLTDGLSRNRDQTANPLLITLQSFMEQQALSHRHPSTIKSKRRTSL